MLIETEPCEDCDFSPEFCSCDIDICQITRGKSKPISEEAYQSDKMRRFQKMDNMKGCGGLRNGFYRKRD